jgi:hypothetical protein
MNRREYCQTIRALGLSQIAAGRLLDNASPRQSQRWASGDAPIPTAVAILLRALCDGKLTVKDVEGYHAN